MSSGTSDASVHSSNRIAVLAVGVFRGLRHPARQSHIDAFLHTLGPHHLVDAFGIFEQLEPDAPTTPARFGPGAANSTDPPCTSQERTALFRDSFGGQGRRFARMRMLTADEAREGRSAGYHLAQFHKLRLAFTMLEEREHERGTAFAAALRLRTDQTFSAAFVGRPWHAHHWLRPQALASDTAYLHHDQLIVASRDVFGRLSRLWEHGTRLDLQTFTGSSHPLNWTRVASSTWAIGRCLLRRARCSCSNFLQNSALPAQLQGAQRADRVALQVRREHKSLTAAASASAAGLLPGWRLSNTGTGTDPVTKRRLVDPEVFLGTAVLHISQPMGSILLQCALPLLDARVPGEKSSTHSVSALRGPSLLHGRLQMRC